MPTCCRARPSPKLSAPAPTPVKWQATGITTMQAKPHHHHCCVFAHTCVPSSAHVHRFGRLDHGHLLECDHALLDDGCGALGVDHGELARVRLVHEVLVVAQVLHAALGDDAQVHVGARPQVVVHARADGACHQVHGLLARHVVLVPLLKHRHGVERAGAHGAEGQRVGGAVRVHGEQVRPVDVDAAQHQRRAHVALVLE
mmetsp:Transcript_28760/g.73224  ORF Transcript_28760/g.73224 Transcript_28760/m.73224 type:complete len:200 (-) Transcript_28760:465-1064(-)